MPRKPLLSRHDLPASFGLLSRLPVPVQTEEAMARGGAVAWAFPLVGAALGALAGAVYLLAGLFGLPQPLAALLALAALIMLTGALHEDGLADTADGFWGGWTVERRLEIMKDSAIGSYGTLALVLSVGFRAAALTTLPSAEVPAALVAAALLSRGAMAALWGALPPARAQGLSATAGRPASAAVLLGAAIAAMGSLALLPVGAALLASAAAGLAALAVGRIARARIGGQTGDVLGAGQQCAEIAVLLALVTALD